MNRSLVRPAAFALAAAALTLILLAVPASTPSQAASISITVNGGACSSFTYNSNTNTLDCQTSSGGGTFGCVIAPSNLSPSVSTPETLTANCSNAAGTVTYSWTAGASSTGCPGIASPTSQATSLAAPGGTTALTCTYNLSANDGATTAATSKTLNYSTSGGGSGGNGGPITCNNVPGGGATRTLDVAWGGSGYTSTAGSFGPTDAVVVRFTTGSLTTTQTNTGSIQAVEYLDPQATRFGALSNTPCDFTVGLPKRTNKSPTGCGYSTLGTGQVNPVAGLSMMDAGSCVVVLQPNTTYYWNLSNVDPVTGASACSSSTGHCNMLITLIKPPGT
jgi:hypothetical protein